MTRNYISGVGVDSFAVQEAAASGLKSMENFIGLMSHESFNSNEPSSSSSAAITDLELARNTTADAAVSKFKRVISLLDRTRTGHARFRRAPVISPIQEIKPTPFQAPPPIRIGSFSSPFKTIDFSSLLRNDGVRAHETPPPSFWNGAAWYSKLLHNSFFTSSPSFWNGAVWYSEPLHNSFFFLQINEEKM